MLVGIFEIEPVPGVEGKWQVTNTKTTFTHRTYGTWEEIEAEYKVQSEAWETRLRESHGRLTARGKFQNQVPKKKSA